VSVDRSNSKTTALAAQTPIARMGRPEDIAQAIAFLVSDGFLSGETIVCNPGLRWTTGAAVGSEPQFGDAWGGCPSIASTYTGPIQNRESHRTASQTISRFSSEA